MSWLFSVIYDPFMRQTERACLEEWRAALLGGVEGRVLEIGAGTGANLPHYPKGLERLVLTEPDPHMLGRLAERAKKGGVAGAEPVLAGSGELPFEEGAFDVVVSTLVLCSVPDVGATLREIRRVLRPGGTLVFLEHVAADDRPDRLVWQRRVEPFWKRVAGNCHLTRRTGEAIREAGFEVEREIAESMRKSLPLVRATVRGEARSPARKG